MEHILEIKTQRERRFIILNKDRYSLGRSSKNSIVIQDRQVSRYHATLIRKNKNKSNNVNNYSFSVNNNKVKLDNYCFWIHDGDLQGKTSSNGIAINQQYCSSHLLEYGDLIELGDNVILKYYKLSAETLKLIQGIKPLAKIS